MVIDPPAFPTPSSHTQPKSRGTDDDAPSEGGSNKKQRGYKRSKGGCLNCKFRKVKCDEIRPTCTACQRLSMPCGNWGATLSKAAYAEEKQAFLEQVRRRGLGTEARPKRMKRVPVQSPEDEAQAQLRQMQFQLGMAGMEGLDVDDVTGLHTDLGNDFSSDVSQGYYSANHYGIPHDASQPHDNNGNLFEMNPRAAAIHQQLQKLQTATRDHDEVRAPEGVTNADTTFSTEPNGTFSVEVTNLMDASQSDTYVPSMISIDNLMSQQHVVRPDQQREAEEAAVRARKEETLNKQRRYQDVET